MEATHIDAATNGHGDADNVHIEDIDDVELGSFQDQIAEERRQLAKKQTVMLPLAGFDHLFARYKLLTFREMRKITRRNEKVHDPDEQDIRNAADVLINGCTDVLVKRENGSFGRIGQGWNPQTVSRLLRVELESDATARQALRQFFAGDDGDDGETRLMAHSGKYNDWLMEKLGLLDEAAEGESEAA